MVPPAAVSPVGAVSGWGVAFGRARVKGGRNKGRVRGLFDLPPPVRCSLAWARCCECIVGSVVVVGRLPGLCDGVQQPTGAQWCRNRRACVRGGLCDTGPGLTRVAGGVCPRYSCLQFCTRNWCRRPTSITLSAVTCTGVCVQSWKLGALAPPSVFLVFFSFFVYDCGSPSPRNQDVETR